MIFYITSGLAFRLFFQKDKNRKLNKNNRKRRRSSSCIRQVVVELWKNSSSVLLTILHDFHCTDNENLCGIIVGDDIHTGINCYV